MSCPICTFRKPDGIRCGSPALYGHNYCYFHTRTYRDAAHGARARRRYSTRRFALPPPDSLRPPTELGRCECSWSSDNDMALSC